MADTPSRRRAPTRPATPSPSPSSPSAPLPSPFVRFTRRDWSRLRKATPLTLTPADLAELQGVNEQLSLPEVSQIYLSLSRLLSLHVAAVQDLHRVRAGFVGRATPKVPYIIGIAGSVAVGKSTVARLLRALLARWPSHPKVELVTTDGFLLPNQVLERRKLMHRKGFPESYDVKGLLAFLDAIKSGQRLVRAPIYSHLAYDILPDRQQEIRRPDILILEGLNVLQTGRPDPALSGPGFVSDYFDFSLYIDAEEGHIEKWFVDRFLTFRTTAFRDPASYFHRYAALSKREAIRVARQVWREINGVNLRENILPTRTRADLILTKGPDHRIESVQLRRI